MKRIVSIIAIIFISACASTGAIPIGQDTYMISKQGAGAMVSVGSIKADLFKESIAFCGTKGQTFQVINTRDQPGGFGHLPEAEMQFMCLNSGDAEIQRPKLRKMADTVIEIQK